VLDGDFTYKLPTQAQLDSCRFVIDHIRNTDGIDITKIHGHGWYPGGTSTACPGNTWPLWRDYVKEPLPPAEDEMKWVELDNYIEVLGEQKGKVFTTTQDSEGVRVQINGLPECAKLVLARLVIVGPTGSWVSIGHRKEGAYASIMACFPETRTIPKNATAFVPVDSNNGLYLLRRVPTDHEILVWIRVYGYWA
jgi:hypothetical protein